MSLPIPSGQTGFVPHLCCSPCVEAIEFYKKAFGAREVRRIFTPDGARIMHAAIDIDGHQLFLVDDFPEYCGGKSQTAVALGGTPVTVHRFVDNCDQAIARAVEAGAIVEMPPMDAFWGDRYGSIRDPFGHRWSLATRMQDLTDQQIMEGMRAAFAQMG